MISIRISEKWHVFYWIKEYKKLSLELHSLRDDLTLQSEIPSKKTQLLKVNIINLERRRDILANKISGFVAAEID